MATPSLPLPLFSFVSSSLPPPSLSLALLQSPCFYVPFRSSSHFTLPFSSCVLHFLPPSLPPSPSHFPVPLLPRRAQLSLVTGLERDIWLLQFSSNVREGARRTHAEVCHQGGSLQYLTYACSVHLYHPTGYDGHPHSVAKFS